MLDSIGSPLQKGSSGRRRGYYGGEVNAKEDRTGEAVLRGMLRLYMLHPRDWVYDVKLDSAEALQGGCCSTRFVAASASERSERFRYD